MPMPSCSDCSAGNHDSCDAQGRAMCGCRQEGHVREVVTSMTTSVPMGDVLDAATRAPQPEPTPEPDLAAQVAAQTLPTPPGMVDPEAAAATVLAHLPGGALPPLPGPTDDEVATEPTDEALDVSPGVVGLPGALAALADAHQAAIQANFPKATAEAQAELDTPAQTDPSPGAFIMAGPRDPRAHVSLWDSGRCALAGPSSPDEVGYDAATGEPVHAGGDPDALDAESAAAGDPEPEHTYDGTDAVPYRCACGAEPGSLNKLGSHLGIIGDADAMAELGTQTVPHVIAQKAAERGETEAATGGLVAPLPDGSPLAIPEPSQTPIADAERLVVQQIADGTLPPLPGPSDEELDDQDDAESTDAFLAELAQADALLEHFGFDPTTVPPPGQQFMTSSTEVLAPVDADSIDPAQAPGHVIIHVDGTTGHVYGHDGSMLPTELADALLEHYGFDPSPIDGDAPAVRADLAPYEVPAAPFVSMSTTGRSLGSGPVTATPTRVQQARLTTSCGSCTDPITPGTLMGHVVGLGWCHLTHD